MREKLFERLGRALPIARWGARYDATDARHDLWAGLTVGVVLVPQGMAYAVLAGVPPIYGLFASLAPLLVYPLLGTSRHTAVGVTAISMVVVASGVSQVAEPGSQEYVALAILLAAMVGLLEIAMGAARLGFLANLLSRPVITGFSAAAALVIAAGQFGNLLGMEVARSPQAFAVVADALGSLDRVHRPSLLLGAGSIAALLGLRRWRPRLPAELLIMVAATAGAGALGFQEAGIEVVGDVPAGLPLPGLVEVELESVRSLLPTVATLALVQFMAVVSLGRVFAARHRYTIDPNRELMAIGAANLAGSFFRSLPVSGSFSRSTVNEQAGARTPLANVFAATTIGVVLLFLTPLLHHVPMPVLAAIIIVAGLGLVDVAEARYLFRAKTSDGWVALATFALTLGLGLQEGILGGIGLGVLLLLYRISRPHVAELGHLRATRSFKRLERFSEAEPTEGVLVLRVEAGFSFFNAKFLRDFILEKAQEEDRRVRAVVIDGMSVNYLDTTAVEALEEVVRTLQDWGIEMHFAGLTAPVRDTMASSGLGERLGEERFHIDPYHAVLDVLGRWDEEEGTGRAEAYEREAEKEREEVEPTSESPLT